MPKITLQTVFCTTILIACLVPLHALAKIYKWTDKDGSVHFSQTPRDADKQDEVYNLRFQKNKTQPVAEKEEKEQSGTKSSQSADQKPKTVQEKVAAMEKQQKEAAKKAAHEAKEIAAKKANCQSAQKRLLSVSQGGRIYDIDKNGERSYWDDNTRQSKISETQSLINKWCG